MRGSALTLAPTAALLASLAACSRSAPKEDPRPPPPAAASPAVTRAVTSSSARAAPKAEPGALRELTWHYDKTALGPSEVVVSIPDDGKPGDRYPVLVAFHGRGESLKGPKRGARGFVDDYAMPAAIRRLHSPPLTSDDLLGFATPERLGRLNRVLKDVPYHGLIVVCPFLPDVLRGSRAFDEGRALASFVVDELLPRVYKETPAIGTPATTGVDGVSLGGRAALLVGLFRPEAFGSVAALQPALDVEEAQRLADMAKDARDRNGKFAFRLLTSDEDYFLEPTKELDRALSARGVMHDLDVVVGPHSYEFNRGPGVYEMLTFHDWALRSAAMLGAPDAG